MKITEEQKKAYLEAIGFQGELEPSFDCLKRIVEGHIFRFPYETITVHDSDYDLSHRPRSNVKFKALFDKMVINKRGGRCVELNIFLQTVLKEIGFNVTSILPETLWHCEDKPKAERWKHSAAIVKIGNEDYLVDAAFGGLGLLSPLRLEKGGCQQYSEYFRLISSDDYPYVFQTWKNEKWTSIYGFTLSPTSFAEYEKIDLANRDPLDPRSVFKDFFVCTKPFKILDENGSYGNGRYKIFNDDFIVFENNQETHRLKIKDQSTLQSIMQQYFDIDLKKHFIRYSELDIRANLEGIRIPPVLHSYQTRQLEKYRKIAGELNVELEVKPRIRSYCKSGPKVY